MSGPDYTRLYDDYWSRTDRTGKSSFTDADALAERVLSVCGPGPILDVGCGMGLLVRTFLGRGLDARGLDVSPVAVAQANRLAPGCYGAGSILAIPYPTDTFDTVLATDMLEHLAEEDAPKALAELCRVTRRYAFLTISTIPDRDGKWHLTCRDRSWWEERAFAAGFRKHPGMHTLLSYESLESEGAQITLLLEKVPADLPELPTGTSDGEAQLHADMLRVTGRRADAHTARYALAGEYVRPGDTVLDVACGLGYGSAILAAASPAGKVIGVDRCSQAVAYAKQAYGSPLTEFREGDATVLAFLGNDSVDLVVSFETLEHLDRPEAFLGEALRVLRPGGRIIVSVPNHWTDEHGRDPNPHHLHVYDWATLTRQLGAGFILEQAHAQIAGGGLILNDQPRTLRPVSIHAEPQVEAEWWLMTAMKDPTADAKGPYRPTCYPEYADLADYHLTDFATDYDNPWLVKSMVSLGLRQRDPRQLETLARKVLASARPGSADCGAALCILAYQALETPLISRDEVAAMLDQLNAYHEVADDSAHAWRWRISNQYVAGRLLLNVGQREQALAAFRACATMDCLKFSPLLATKTVDAWFRAGVIELARGEADEAGRCWRAGLEETRRVLTGDWTNIWGRPEEPVRFGLHEVEQVVDLAARCANGLANLQQADSRPGLCWSLTHANKARDLHHIRSFLKAQPDHIAGLQKENRRAWEEAQRLAEGWETQNQRLQELEKIKDDLWNELQKNVRSKEHLQEAMEKLRQYGLYRLLRRVGLLPNL